MPKNKRVLKAPSSPTSRAVGTRRRRAAPSASRRLLDSLLAHGGSCIAIVEGPEVRFTLVSPDYQAIAPQTTMLGRTYRQVFPEAAENGAEARLRHVLATGEPWLVDAYHAPVAGKPDATWQGKVMRLPLEPGQQPTALIVLLDITERVRAERAAREREEQLRFTLESIGDGFLACDAAWNLVYINARAEELLGSGREELLGKSYWEAFPSTLGTRLEAEFHRAAAGESRSFENFYAPWGRWFHNRCFPRQGGGMVVYFKDITERKRAEEALLTKTQQLESLLSGAPLGVAFFDRQHRYLQINEELAALKGIPAAEHIGRTVEEMLPLSGRAIGAVLDRVFQTGEVLRNLEISGETPLKPGIQRHWLTGLYPVREERGQVAMVGAWVTDITASKRIEAALRASEQQLRVALEAGRMGTWAWDLPTDTIVADAWHRRLWDIPGDEAVLPGKLLLSRMHPEDTGKVYTSETARTIQGPLDLEFRICRRDGEVRWLRCFGIPLQDQTGALTKLIGVNFDVTETKQAEAALRQSEQKFRQVVESLPQMVWTTGPDGACDYLSPQWVAYTGQPEEPQLGFGWLEHVHPEDRASVGELWCQSAQRGVPYEAEFRVRRHDGVYRWFRTLAVPLRDEAGRIIKWFGSNTDITEQREAQQVLARSKEELERLVTERTAKLQEMVGELEHFSYTITHDMRAPLRAMRGFAELVLELGEADPRPEQRSLLRRIVTAAERMDLLITDSLSYSRAVRQQLPLGPVDLGCLLRGMLDTYPEYQTTNARIHIEGELPLVLGNQAGLTQVFSNLLGNAIKFTGPGKLPAVRIWAEGLRKVEGGAEGQPATAAPADAALHSPPFAVVRVWVEDQGIGIPPSMVPRVFNMFARGMTGHPGTGIGLALVRKVVDRMGGRVGVLSEEGVGSRFWVELLPGDPRMTALLPLPSPPPRPGDIL